MSPSGDTQGIIEKDVIMHIIQIYHFIYIIYREIFYKRRLKLGRVYNAIAPIMEDKGKL